MVGLGNSLLIDSIGRHLITERAGATTCRVRGRVCVCVGVWVGGGGRVSKLRQLGYYLQHVKVPKKHIQISLIDKFVFQIIGILL